MRVFTEEHRRKLSDAKKGKPSWNKGLAMWWTPARMTGQVAWNKGKKGEYTTSKKGKKQPHVSGENHWNWSEVKASYRAIHGWLVATFGNPSSCDFCGTTGERVRGKWSVEWSLIRGCSYERKRENFHPLCRKCHRKYDYDEYKKVRSSNGRFVC